MEGIFFEMMPGRRIVFTNALDGECRRGPGEHGLPVVRRFGPYAFQQLR